jgi:hypothetical protein
MQNLHTLNTIIDDILLEIRSQNISESEPISRLQVENWIIEYRSILIKQDIDKGRNLNPDYIQSIDNISITDKDSDGNSLSKNEVWISRTNIELPNGIDFHFDDSVVSITDEFDNLIQLTSEKRAKRQQDRRWTKHNSMAYEKDARIYITGYGDVSKINIRAIFENPMDPILGLSANERYPMPANMIPTMKEMIITKEVIKPFISDTTNDSVSNPSVIQTKK